MGLLLVLFTIVPIVELFLLIEVGQIIGAWDTVFFVLVTGVVGAYVARSQGVSIWMGIQQKLSKGELPTESLAHGLLVFVGGLLLITPGFITDFLGLALVFPFTRTFFTNKLMAYFRYKMSNGQFQFYTNINGEWHDMAPPRDVTKPSQEVRGPAKVIDIDTFRNSK